MAEPDQFDILAMRAMTEIARMEDLAQLLPFASRGEEDIKSVRYQTRINDRIKWAASLGSHSDGWTEWSTGHEDADFLVDELVARVMTQLLRSNGLDAGIFDAGESLIEELIKRTGVPRLVLGHSQLVESLDYTGARVSMRFPGARIWDIPILAHEFGHHALRELPHVEPILRDKRPLSGLVGEGAKALVETGVNSERASSHAEELLADCIATVCCGPTYPIACLVLRVPPGAEAARASRTHPAWPDRVATMRRVLDELTISTGQGRYRHQRETVIDPLVGCVLGRIPELPPAGEILAQESIQRLQKHCPQLIYAEADSAIRIASGLASQKPEPPEAATIRSVLDGAWRWRLAQSRSVDHASVAAAAVTYCRRIAERSSQGRNGP